MSNLLNKIVNVRNYHHLVFEYDGRDVWDNAFNEAYKKLTEGSILIIPKGEYEFFGRSVLKNKNNITVFCEGVLKPVASKLKVPLIGTLTINNCHNCTFHSLSFDGNKDYVKPTNVLGRQSLVEMNDCSNMVFNSIKFVNTAESCFNSNGNIKNIEFNDAHIENAGEHGFYFGGSDSNNIRFNNSYCKNIGMNTANLRRNSAFIKLRNKKEGDTLHDNILIDGFTFISETEAEFDRQLVQAYDTKNVIVRNGIIKGKDTSIFGGNISIDSIVVDNVDFDGRRIAYAINKNYGWDTTKELPTVPEISSPGLMNNRILNSIIKIRDNHAYLNDIAEYYNCYIYLNNRQLNDSMSSNLNRMCRFDSCVINTGSGRIDIRKTTDCSFVFTNVIFTGYEYNRGQNIIHNQSDAKNNYFKTSNAVAETYLPYLIGVDSDSDVTINNCYLNSGIRTELGAKFNNVDISCSALKNYVISSTTNFDKLNAYKVYDITTGERKDYITKIVTIPAGKTSVTVNMYRDRMDEINDNSIEIITSIDNAVITKTVENNFVTIEISSVQQEDVEIEFIYRAGK